MICRPARVMFVVNGGCGSAAAERAEAFKVRLAKEYDIRLIFRKGNIIWAAWRMLLGLWSFRPAACYVFDLAAAGVIAAGLYKHTTGTPFIVDTGDAIVELGRVLGRGPAGILATRCLEAYALRAASIVVVRGSYHQELLAKRGIRSVFIPDGVDVDQFAPQQFQPPDPNRPLVIGLVGSAVWVPVRNNCYGWDLVELIQLLRDKFPIRGVFIGNGNGLEVLKQSCRTRGIAELIDFPGRIPLTQLPSWLQQFDICLSTQTDDEIGWVRTTGKLPLYLAAGRFVLASRVGEAARVLPPEMLIDFRGAVDPEYPKRVADRVVDLVAHKTQFSPRTQSIALARDHFEYDILARRLANILKYALAKASDPVTRLIEVSRCDVVQESLPRNNSQEEAIQRLDSQ